MSQPESEIEGPIEWNVGDVVLGMYEVTKDLGEGGFGKVYKVHHSGWNLDLAVKSVRPELAQNDSEITDFIRECKIWVDLGLHPNIVSCYYVRRLGGLPRVFIEYMSGGTLRSILAKKKLDWSMIVDFSIQILDGLDFAHQRGLVHLDIKPENIMLDAIGSLKITDFGLASARAVLRKESPDSIIGTLTIREGIGGTPVYMPPEQWDAEHGEIGSPTDIYAFGVMLYEMVCGRRPFDDGTESIAIIKSRHIESSPPNPIKIRPDIPERLSYVIQRCLEKNPKNRFSSCVGLRELMVQIYQEISGQSYPRRKPNLVSLKADELNNHGVSMVDLGETKRAISILDEALEIDSQHLEATYNRGLIQWRQGVIADDELIKQLESVKATHSNNWKSSYLLGLAHLERGDMKSAENCFIDSLKQGADTNDCQDLLNYVQSAIMKPQVTSFDINNPVSALAISPYDSLIIVGDYKGNLSKFNLISGKSLQKKKSHEGPINCVKFDSENTFVSSGDDGVLRKWDSITGRCVSELDTSSKVTSIALSQDGFEILSGAFDAKLDLWDYVLKRRKHALEGHKKGSYLQFVSFMTREDRAISASSEGEIKFWDIETGTEELARSLGIRNLSAITITPDGKFCVLCKIHDPILQFFDLSSSKLEPILKLEGHSKHRGVANSVTCLHITDDGKWAVSGADDNTVRLWNLSEGRCQCTLKKHRDSISAIALSTNQEWLVTGSVDKTMRIWHVGHTLISDSRQKASFKLSVPRPVERVQEIDDIVRSRIQQAEQSIARCEWEDAARLIADARTEVGFEREPELLTIGRRIGTHGTRVKLQSLWMNWKSKALKGEITCCDISPDGTMIVCGDVQGGVHIFEMESGRSLHTFNFSKGIVGGVAFSINSEIVLTTQSNTVRLLDAGTGECIQILEPEKTFVNEYKQKAAKVTGQLGFQIDKMVFSQDGKTALSSHRGGYGDGDYKILRRWNIETGKVDGTLKGHNSEIKAIAISADGSQGLSGDIEGVIRLWDLKKTKCTRKFRKVSPLPPTHFAFSNDCLTALSGFSNGDIIILDLDKGTTSRKMNDDGGSIQTVVFSPEERFLYSKTRQGVKIWDCDSTTVANFIEGTSLLHGAIAVSLDGNSIAFSEGSRLQTWNLDWKYEFA